MTRRVVLWRHGRTEWNVAGRVQGQTDTSLDDVGREQARAAAARLASLRPVRILSSDLERARDTAEELSRVTGV
ncbi:MAG: histidine phosphatase family protein, partial [Actinomycetales bacterium]